MGIVIRQTVKGSIANYIGVAFGFINILFIMTWIFSEEEVGLIRMLIENHVALAGFAMMGITSSMYRYYPYFNDGNNPDHLNGFYFWSSLVPFIGFLAISLLLVGAKSWISGLFQENAGAFLEYYLLLIPMSFTYVFFGVFETAAAIEGRIVVPKILKEVVLRGLSTVVFFAYYLEWLTFHQCILALMGTYFIPLILIVAYFTKLRKVVLRPQMQFIKDRPKMVKDFIGYTALITVGSVSGMLLSKLDQIMLSSQKGLDLSGIYAIAFYVAMIIEIPRRALIQMIHPTISTYMKEGDTFKTEEMYKRVGTLLFIPGLFLLMGLLVNLDNIYAIMPNGERYISGISVIVLISIAKALEMTTITGQVIVMHSRFYYILFVMTVLTTLLGIYLNLWLIPGLGIMGAAIATFITIIAQQLIVVLSIWFKLKIHPFTISLLWLSLLFIGVLSGHFVLPGLGPPVIDLILRSFLFPFLFIWGVYKLKVNSETNQFIDNVIQRIKDRNFKLF